MSTNMMINPLKTAFLLAALVLVGCSSGPEKPTTDTCTIKKHYKDNIYQVRINKKAINKFWYLKQDALRITKDLAKKNKCMH